MVGVRLGVSEAVGTGGVKVMVAVWVVKITAVAEGTAVGVLLPCGALPGDRRTATSPAK